MSPAGPPIEFVGLGAQKAGTTSLWEALVAQPWFAGGPTKELRYFTANHHRGVDWYLAQFPPARAGLVRGEISPDYLWDREAPGRMWRHNPGLRMVAVLRDPIERARSAYAHGQRVRAIPRGMSFEDVVRLETAQQGRLWFVLVRGGLYFRQLSRYLEHFPREQLHVLLFEDLIDPAGPALADALRFVAAGAGPTVPLTLPHVNAGRAPASLGRWRLERSAERALRRGQPERAERLLQRARRVAVRSTAPPVLSEATRRMLLERFAPENAALADLLGIDLSAWER
ncbi:MAG: hypothetical protein RLZZ272_1133 [Actinomycetota bacterium]